MIVVVVVVDDDDRVLYTASRPRCHYNRLAGCNRAAVEKRSESREEKDGNAVIEQRKDGANARERIRERMREDERARGEERRRGLTGGPREKRLRLVVAAGVEMY